MRSHGTSVQGLLIGEVATLVALLGAYRKMAIFGNSSGLPCTLGGVHSITFTKVKGHATHADVQAGRATADQTIGNNHADIGATNGTDQHLPGLLPFAKWLKDRHNDYCKFMGKIHQIIIAVLKEEKKLRKGRQHYPP